MDSKKPSSIVGRNRAISEIKRKRLETFSQVGLYPVTSEALSNGRTDFQVLEAVLKCGVPIIQLRDKHSSKKNLFKKAEIFREATRKSGALLIINDHLDIALGVNADGIHLGQEFHWSV